MTVKRLAGPLALACLLAACEGVAVVTSEGRTPPEVGAGMTAGRTAGR